MNGQQIGDELGITRQAVSKILQKAIHKVYYKLEGSPKEKLMSIINGFNINDDSDMKAIYKLLPNSEKDKIKLDLKKTFHIKD